MIHLQMLKLSNYLLNCEKKFREETFHLILKLLGVISKNLSN